MYPFKQSKFCSEVHENYYYEEQSGEGLRRLLDPEFPQTPARSPEVKATLPPPMSSQMAPPPPLTLRKELPPPEEIEAAILDVDADPELAPILPQGPVAPQVSPELEVPGTLLSVPESMEPGVVLPDFSSSLVPLAFEFLPTDVPAVWEDALPQPLPAEAIEAAEPSEPPLSGLLQDPLPAMISPGRTTVPIPDLRPDLSASAPIAKPSSEGIGSVPVSGMLAPENPVGHFDATGLYPHKALLLPAPADILPASQPYEPMFQEARFAIRLPLSANELETEPPPVAGPEPLARTATPKDAGDEGSHLVSFEDLLPGEALLPEVVGPTLIEPRTPMAGPVPAGNLVAPRTRIPGPVGHADAEETPLRNAFLPSGADRGALGQLAMAGLESLRSGFIIARDCTAIHRDSLVAEDPGVARALLPVPSAETPTTLLPTAGPEPMPEGFVPARNQVVAIAGSAPQATDITGTARALLPAAWASVPTTLLAIARPAATPDGFVRARDQRIAVLQTPDGPVEDRTAVRALLPAPSTNALTALLTIAGPEPIPEGFVQAQNQAVILAGRDASEHTLETSPLLPLIGPALAATRLAIAGPESMREGLVAAQNWIGTSSGDLVAEEACHRTAILPTGLVVPEIVREVPSAGPQSVLPAMTPVLLAVSMKNAGQAPEIIPPMALLPGRPTPASREASPVGPFPVPQGLPWPWFTPGILPLHVDMGAGQIGLPQTETLAWAGGTALRAVLSYANLVRWQPGAPLLPAAFALSVRDDAELGTVRMQPELRVTGLPEEVLLPPNYLQMSGPCSVRSLAKRVEHESQVEMESERALPNPDVALAIPPDSRPVSRIPFLRRKSVPIRVHWNAATADTAPPPRVKIVLPKPAETRVPAVSEFLVDLSALEETPAFPMLWRSNAFNGRDRAPAVAGGTSLPLRAASLPDPTPVLPQPYALPEGDTYVLSPQGAPVPAVTSPVPEPQRYHASHNLHLVRPAALSGTSPAIRPTSVNLGWSPAGADSAAMSPAPAARLALTPRLPSADLGA